MARQILGVFLVLKLLRSRDVVPVQSLNSRMPKLQFLLERVETQLAVCLVNQWRQWALHTEFHPRLALNAVIIGWLLMMAAAAEPLRFHARECAFGSCHSGCCCGVRHAPKVSFRLWAVALKVAHSDSTTMPVTLVALDLYAGRNLLRG